jgi:hypothetical protein
MILAVLAACGDEGGAQNSQEVITTVILKFTPASGSAIEAKFDDPDGDGGNPPTVDPIALAAGSYGLTVRFQNGFESPPEEITDEVRDEQNFHLVLFTGDAPLMQTYKDMDDNGLPVGLSSDVTASAGSGKLIVTLRHMPPELPPVKAADTVMMAKMNGVETIGGATDAQVEFDVTVSP